MKLIFELAFRTPYEPSDKEKKKKAILLFRGGDDMKDLSEHVGTINDTGTFDAAVTKIRTGLQGRTNNVVQRNLVLANYPHGTKSFECWSKEISNAAELMKIMTANKLLQMQYCCKHRSQSCRKEHYKTMSHMKTCLN